MLDTGLALQLRAAGGLLEEETKKLGRILQRRALEHRDTVMIGRTHGVHAEPITFGMVLGLWAFEVERGLRRLQRAVQQVSVGKISGAVVQLCHVDPQVEQITMSILDLGSAPVSTQVIQRDRHAEFMSALALLAVRRSRRLPCRCATTNALRSSRPKSILLLGRRDHRDAAQAAILINL